MDCDLADKKVVLKAAAWAELKEYEMAFLKDRSMEEMLVESKAGPMGILLVSEMATWSVLRMDYSKVAS